MPLSDLKSIKARLGNVESALRNTENRVRKEVDDVLGLFNKGGNLAGSNTDILVFPARLRGDADNGSAHVRFKTLDEKNDGMSVHLFIPPGFSVPDSATYTTMELGTLGGAEAMSQGQAITEQDVVGQAAKIGGLVDMGVGGTGLGVAAGGKAALRAGIANNPFTETQFTSNAIRTFGFNFKLISESEAEADVALQIEHFFRSNMYAEVAGASALKYPNRFKIDFWNGAKENKYLPKIIECYLTAFNTSYNATSNSFHTNGQPVEIDIACTFQETKALTRGDLYPGGNN